ALIPGAAEPGLVRAIASTLVGAMIVHVALVVGEHVLGPAHTRHRQLATDAIRRGPFARLFWGGAIAAGAAAVIVAALAANVPARLALAAAAALASSFAWEYIWVEAGQAVPLS